MALEAQRILDTIQEHSNHGFDQTVIPCGGEHYMATGEEWVEGSFDVCKNETDAIFLGAIGYPEAVFQTATSPGVRSFLVCEAVLTFTPTSDPSNSTRACRTKSTVVSDKFGNPVWLT